MKKLVPESIDESVQNVFKPKSKKAQKQHIEQRSIEYGISNPTKKVKGQIEIAPEGDPIERIIAELNAYGVRARPLKPKKGQDHIDVEDYYIVNGTRKALGVWAVEKYGVTDSEVNGWLDGGDSYGLRVLDNYLSEDLKVLNNHK